MLRPCSLFFLVLTNTILVVESNYWCHTASLSTTDEKLIDDCDIVNDELSLRLSKITKLSSCISKVRLVFQSLNPQPDITIPTEGKHTVKIANPVLEDNRCFSNKIHITVTFAKSAEDTWSENHLMEVNPLANRCLKDKEIEYRPSSAMSATVNIAYQIPKKIWNLCLKSVRIGDRADLDPNWPFLKTFPRNQCRDMTYKVYYMFKGSTTAHTKTLTFLKGVYQHGKNVQVIKNCDLFEEELTISVNQLISRPQCNKRTYVKVGDTRGQSYWDGVGKAFERRENPFKTGDVEDKKQCRKTKVIVATLVDSTDFETTFEMDPMNCFNSKPRLKVWKEDEGSVTIDLFPVAEPNKKLFKMCLKDIKVFAQNNTEAKYDKVLGNDNLLNLTTLNRLEDMNLTVEFIFEEGIQISKLFVPYSRSLAQKRKEQKRKEREEMESESFRRNVILPIGAASGGAILLLLLIALTAVYIRKRKSKDPKTTNYNTDENHTYGTYATGDDGEYEYNVTEVVDNNELYGAVGGAETRDNNEYYET